MRRLLAAIASVALLSGSTLASASISETESKPRLPEEVRAFLNNDRSNPYGDPHPDAPPENQFMGDLIGAWSCKTFGIWEATWAFKHATGGFSIEHLYFMRKVDLVPPFEPLGRDYYNPAVALYDPVIDAWRQLGTENFGDTLGSPNTTVQTGRVEDDVLVLEPDDQDEDLLVRNTFHDVTDKTFMWTQYESTDDGQTWEVAAFITCDRIDE